MDRSLESPSKTCIGLSFRKHTNMLSENSLFLCQKNIYDKNENFEGHALKTTEGHPPIRLPKS